MKLRRAHDIGESLQNRIEEMEDVERAFVHIDFETSHFPEHADGKRSSRRLQHSSNTVPLDDASDDTQETFVSDDIKRTS